MSNNTQTGIGRTFVIKEYDTTCPRCKSKRTSHIAGESENSRRCKICGDKFEARDKKTFGMYLG